MNPERVAQALERLREAGRRLRQLPVERTLEALSRVFDGWSDPASPWRKRLGEELPAVTGFDPEMVREGLARGFAPLRGEALRDLVEHELGGRGRLEGRGTPRISGYETTAVLLAGAIPMPTLIASAAPLVLRSPVLVKTSRHDPLTARLVAGSLREIDPGLGACAEVVHVASDDAACLEALLRADCIVASGSDATIAAVSKRLPATQRLVSHGHRLSLAVLGPRAASAGTLERCARALALDVAFWDQLGCLSPVAIYVVDPRNEAADAVADAMARALAEAEERWPRGRIDVSAAASITHERAEAELRAAAGGTVRVHAGRGTSWTVVREADGKPRAAPLHRFVRVHPVPELRVLFEWLRPLAHHLAGVALEGFGPENRQVGEQCADLGASRICAPGTLQAPPLAWHHDNRGVLLPMARFSDVEVV
jgi:hypothetical protein